MTVAPPNSIVAPRIDFDQRLGQSNNLFSDVFGTLSPEEWSRTLVTSINTPTIDGVEFPSFPPEAMQSQLTGSSGEAGLRDAALLYQFLCERNLTGPNAPWFATGHMLDFGAGWGRILRMFMRDFPLRNIIGFEPNGTFCAVARAHNPFVSFVSGEYSPPTPFNNQQFNLITGFSIFSHLSERAARSWLREFERLLAPNGAAVMTTWGLRFLERLMREQKLLEQGEDIHWYSRGCLKGAGDLNQRIRDYHAGSFVWFDTHSKDYGEAFLGEQQLKFLIKDQELALEVELFDSESLSQDIFILRRI